MQEIFRRYLTYTIYKIYTIYMEYTVSEFRKNSRKILNDIDAGKRVSIRRYDRIYNVLPSDLRVLKKSGVQVITLSEEATSKLESERTVEIRPINQQDVTELGEALRKRLRQDTITVESELLKETPRFQRPLCKAHGLPLDNRGRCLQKGCKYA